MERTKINLNESATTVIAVGSVEDEGPFGDFTDTVTCDCVCLFTVRNKGSKMVLEVLRKEN